MSDKPLDPPPSVDDASPPVDGPPSPGAEPVQSPEMPVPVEPPGRSHRDAELARLRHERQEAQLQARLDELEASRMPLLDHLIELRNRVMISVAAVVVGSIVGFIYAREIYEFLTIPFVEALSEAGVEGGLALVSSPFEGVFTYFKVALIAGVMLAAPVVFYQVWAFVAPGLYKTEKRVVAPLAATSFMLFALGSGFCFYVIFPYAFPFFIGVLGVDVSISVDGYLSSVLWMMLAFGGAFQLPVVVFFLATAGILDAKDLIKGFRYAVIGIFVLAAAITPPDPLTQILLAVPLIILYGVGIVVAYFVSTKKRDEDADDAPGSSGKLDQ